MNSQFDVSSIDEQISYHERHILESKVVLARLRACKTSTIKNYEFLRTHKEADEMIKILTKFPQIKSARELQIVFYISKMRTAKQMADDLFISEKTVKCHKTSIYRKLGVKSEKELLAKYFSKVEHSDALPVSKCL